MVLPAAGASPGGPAAQTTGSRLGRDAFLDLLLTQLRQQDPLKPMEDREFISQLAQFNTLEELQQLRQVLSEGRTIEEAGRAASLLGRTVGWVLPSGAATSAKVTEVQLTGGGPVLVTSSGAVALRDVVSIT